MTWLDDPDTLLTGETGYWLASAYPGFGIIGADIPATGDDGPSPLYNDNIDPTAEYRWEIVTWPPAGVLTTYEDTSFLYDGTSVGQGLYQFTYRVYRNNEDVKTARVNIQLGPPGGALYMSASGGAESSGSAKVSLGEDVELEAHGDVVASGAATMYPEFGLSGQGYSEAETTSNLSVAKDVSGPATSQSSAISTPSINVDLTKSTYATAEGGAYLSLTGNNDLSGDAHSRATVTAQINVDKNVSGTGAGVATGEANLAYNVDKDLAATGTSIATGSAKTEFNVVENLEADGASLATGEAQLSLTKDLTESSSGLASGTGELHLATKDNVSATGISRASGYGSLAASLALTESGQAQTEAQARPFLDVNLAGLGQSEATGSGGLSYQAENTLRADGYSQADAQGKLSQDFTLSSDGHSEANASGELEQSIAGNPSAKGYSVATGKGTLNVERSLEGLGQGESEGEVRPFADVDLTGAGGVIATGEAGLIPSRDISASGYGEATGDVALPRINVDLTEFGQANQEVQAGLSINVDLHDGQAKAEQSVHGTLFLSATGVASGSGESDAVGFGELSKGLVFRADGQSEANAWGDFDVETPGRVSATGNAKSEVTTAFPKIDASLIADGHAEATGNALPDSVLPTFPITMTEDGYILVHISGEYSDCDKWDQGFYDLVLTRPDGTSFKFAKGFITILQTCALDILS